MILNPENYGQSVLPGLEEVRLTDVQVRFCQLMAIGFDDDGKKLSNVECAVQAGVGNTRDSSKTLAARYLKDPRFTALIERYRGESLADLQLHNAEVVEGLRLLASISLGQKKVKKTMFNQVSDPDSGSVESVAKTFDVFEFSPASAHQALKTMAEITGMISNKKVVEHSGGLALTNILSELDGTTTGLAQD